MTKKKKRGESAQDLSVLASDPLEETSPLDCALLVKTSFNLTSYNSKIVLMQRSIIFNNISFHI